MDSLTLKRHNPFQNKHNRKATYSFAPRPLIFKLQQEVGISVNIKTIKLRSNFSTKSCLF